MPAWTNPILWVTISRPCCQTIRTPLPGAWLEPLEDYRGSADRRGRPLTVTIIAVADQLAAAAGLLMRKPDGAPVVLIRGYNWRAGDSSARALLRKPELDLFR